MTAKARQPSTLLVSPWTPYPLVFGGAIRVYYLIKMLGSFSDVTLVAFRSWSDVDDVQEQLETICRRVVLVEGKPEQTGRLRARATLSPRSFQYYAHHTELMQRQIDEVCANESFDNIIVTLTAMGFYDLPQTGAVRILDMHNIEHELLLRRAELERKPLKRAGLWVEGMKFRREELEACRSFDLLLTPSDRERAALEAAGGMPPIATVPNTIDPDRIAFLPETSSSNVLLFVGATQVDANRNGLLWFVDQVLPLVEREVPDVQLRIVGGSPPPEVQQLGRRANVTVPGYVADVAPEMAGASVFVVPLLAGGGTRLKILEALAFGVPTVSTSLGAEGLDLVTHEHLLVGDGPAAFAESVVSLLRDRELGDRIRRRGREAVEATYSWQAVAGRLESAIESVRPAS